MAIPDLPEQLINSPVWITAGLPGIGGVIKQELADFIVEEIPAYLPSGQGEHLYLWIEKQDMGGEYFQKQIAQRLGISSGEVGTAGLKDRRAVTRQWVSVPFTAEQRLNRLEGDGIKVLKVDRHSNKLRIGHLHGNRFEIVIRQATNLEILPTFITTIEERGMPNYYGEQRFGRDWETLHLGWTLLHKGHAPAGRFLRKLALSAVQSAVFNSYLGQRVREGYFRQVLAGDVMAKWPAGGLFVTHDPAIEQARFDQREIVHTGPMFGSKMRKAEDVAGVREAHLLESLAIKEETFQAGHKLLEGTRRHNVVYVGDLSWEARGDGILLKCTLPSGSYATILLAELMKTAELAPCD